MVVNVFTEQGSFQARRVQIKMVRRVADMVQYDVSEVERDAT